MIGIDRNQQGFRKGVLIDYDYALDLWNRLKDILLSPVSPEVWPRSLRRPAGDPNLYMSPEELSPNDRHLQKRILDYLEAGVKVRGHRTVRSFYFSSDFSN